MSRDNMFLNVWEAEYAPLIRTINENTKAYTGAKTQQERDQYNEVIRNADARLTELYTQFNDAYKQIFPKAIVVEEPETEKKTELNVAAVPTGSDESVLGVNPNIFTARAGETSSAAINAIETYTYEGEPGSEKKPSADEQYILDVTRKNQLHRQLVDFEARSAGIQQGDPGYEQMTIERNTLTAELLEVDKRIRDYDGGKTPPLQLPKPVQAPVESADVQPEPQLVMPPPEPVFRASDHYDEYDDDDEDEEDDAPPKKKRSGVGIFFLVLLCLALVAGGGYFLRQYFLPQNNGGGNNDNTPTGGDPTAQVDKTDVDYWSDTLSIALPTNYAGTVKSNYPSYDEWAQEVGIESLFSQSEHDSINSAFFVNYIQGKDLETVAENTTKFFWALDVYYDIYNNPGNYGFLQGASNSGLAEILLSVQNYTPVGDVLSTIVSQYDDLREEANGYEYLTIERLWQ